MPALPLDDAGPYVAAAYLVFLALILIYLAIMASKLGRIGRELAELTDLAERRDQADDVVADAPGVVGDQPAGGGHRAGGDEREAMRR